MKIAFATIYDLKDVRRGSGTYYHIAKELERQGHEVHYLGPFDQIGVPMATRLLRRLADTASRRYRSWQDPFIGRKLARAVTRRLACLKADILLTNDYTIAAYSESSTPIILYTDAVFPYNYSANTHPSLSNLSFHSVIFCQHIVRRALRRSAVSAFPTQHALQENGKHCEIRRSRMVLIPFGANLAAPDIEMVQRRIATTPLSSGHIRFIFVGKHWVNKGGAIALDTVYALNSRGFRATINIVGSKPDRSIDGEVATVYGLLDKSVESDTNLLASLYYASDVLILPTRGEGFGVATAEAAAYGLPTLSYRCQGISDAVKHGLTGFLLEPSAGPRQFADLAQSWIKHPDSYRAMALRALARFHEATNWTTAVKRLITEVSLRLPPAVFPSRHPFVV